MENPNYYAIIPANVRYDKDLTPNAKLLYAEITSLCNKEGYCWATNDYFAKLYSVSKVSVSKWISQLVDKGYLNSEIKYKEGSKEILNRYLRLINYPIKEKFNTPIKEKFKDNSTSINSKTNNKISFDVFWEQYDKKVGRVSSEKKWNKLSTETQKLILDFIPKYKKYQPDSKYRKNPDVFFNNRSWEDELPGFKPVDENAPRRRSPYITVH